MKCVAFLQVVVVLFSLLLLLCNASARVGLSVREDVLASIQRASTPGSNPPASLSPEWHAYSSRVSAAAHASGTLDCILDALAYNFSLSLQPERAPLAAIFYALQLDSKCGAPEPPGPPQAPLLLQPITAVELEARCKVGSIFFVNATGGSDASTGTRASPFASITRALAATRIARAPGTGTACIVLREGTHSLGTTQLLTIDDSGLIITSTEGDDEAWVSGGVKLTALSWAPYDTTTLNVWVTDVPVGFVASMPGLNTQSPITRYRRAQFPDFDFETSRDWIDSGSKTIKEWIKPPVYDLPSQFFIDLKKEGLKNDSTMEGYNRFGLGYGGPCAVWRGGVRDEIGYSYWCSNNSAGGGAGQDQQYMLNGYLGYPMGMEWQPTASLLPAFNKWASIPPPESWGPLYDNLPSLGAYQSPGWFTSHMAITHIDAPSHTLNMSADGIYPAGGWQGGRNWWGTNMGKPDNQLQSGPWFVENVFEEISMGGEYWYDVVNSKLYVFYNKTGAPPSDWSLWVPQLEVFFNVSGTMSAPVTDITFAGIAYRDQRKSLLDDWLVPSGGDWALRRAGALHLEGVERVTISGSAFVRTDANAIFLAGYTRNVTIERNECVWVGMSCVGTFGYVPRNDATDGQQPWGTQILYNFFHEFGVQEMQSSGWFNGKSALTRAEGNLMFNMPRAAINLNDGLGGGNNITSNLIFNTCRQSGDHGPIVSVLDGVALGLCDGVTVDVDVGEAPFDSVAVSDALSIVIHDFVYLTYLTSPFPLPLFFPCHVNLRTLGIVSLS